MRQISKKKKKIYKREGIYKHTSPKIITFFDEESSLHIIYTENLFGAIEKQRNDKNQRKIYFQIRSLEVNVIAIVCGINFFLSYTFELKCWKGLYNIFIFLIQTHRFHNFGFFSKYFNCSFHQNIVCVYCCICRWHSSWGSK